MHLHQYFSGVYQSPRLDALHLHTLYLRVGRMNQYKEEWMEHASMLVPTTIKLNQNGTIQATWSNPFPTPEKAGQFGLAVTKTKRAAMAGAAIAAMDGPVPILDWVGLGVTTGMSLIAWYEYYSS